MVLRIIFIIEKILSKAITLALKAHEGQVDKSGMPYAGHIMRVNIYPQRFKQIEKVLEYVSLSNITFEGNSVNVALTMV